MKKVFLILLIAMSTMNAAAQTLWITGYVFSFDNGQANPVPFATIKWCNPQQPEEALFVRFTDISGHYDLGKETPNTTYYVEVSAPGYQTKRKIIGNLPQEIEGNITLHFELRKASGGQIIITHYSVDEGFSSCDNALEILRSIPNTIMEESSILTPEGKSIRLLMNGYSIPDNAIGRLSKIPSDLIKTVEYYDFDAYPEMIYGGVLNLVLVEGPYAGNLDFVPIENEGFTIEEFK